ncbi:MAG TPA: HlyD family secretion protein [Bryobacteraceae bacterium]|nr:HlyD family secretion protein [Bryobacteraceae bacterium]
MANVVEEVKSDIPSTPIRGTAAGGPGGPSASAAAPRKSSRVRLVMLFFLVAAIAAVVATYLHFKDRVSTDDATVDGHVTAIAPKISGNVIQVAVLDNQPVKAGDVLVRIDPRDFQAKVDQAKAAVLEAESRLRSAQVMVPMTNETTQSGTTAADAQLADVQAGLAQAQVDYERAAGAGLAYAEANVRSKQASNDRAQADLARMKTLVDKAEISQQQYDAYVAGARVAEAELRAAQEQVASAQKETAARKAALDAAQSRVNQAKAMLDNSVANRKQVAVRTADAGTASAAVEAAKANLEASELQLSYTTIVAPIDGVVTRKSVEVGQIVAPGQGLMTIIPLQDVWVTANFKETQLANVHPGQTAEIDVDMYGRSVKGHVDSIAGATGSRLSLLPPENATGNFVKVVQRIPVKILVDERDKLILRPGMNVDVTIFTR